MSTTPSPPGLLGQDGPWQEFWQSSRSGKLAQSWIFIGPKGVGKATAAKAIMRELLSNTISAQADEVSAVPSAGLFGDIAPPPPKPVENVHSPDHPLYRRVEAGVHPDTLVIQLPKPGETAKPVTELNVDRLRLVGEFLRSTPAEGSWRIVLIDDADCMNKNAANALLKILEEPPPRSIIILIAATLGFFPPTIRSRCRVLRFAPLSSKVFTSLLIQHHPALRPPQIELLTHLAGSSIGQAEQIIKAEGLELYDQCWQFLTTLATAGKGTDFNSWHGLADKIDQAGNTGGQIFSTVLQDIVHPFSPRAQDPIVSALLARYSPDFWLQCLADWQELAAQQEFLYLDRKQAWLNLMTRFAA